MSAINPYSSRPGHDAPARGGRQLIALAVFVGLLLNFGPRLVTTLVDAASEPSSVSVVGTAPHPAG